MKRLFLFVLCCSVFIVSCNRNQVKLAFTNARDEVPVLGNFIFRFSSELATDSMLNKWDSTEYISFSPAIKGRFRWEARDQLVFSPAGPLMPATGYTATFNKSRLLKGTDFDAIANADEVTFKTPDLLLERQLFGWVKDESGKNVPVPVFELHFNYPVLPAEIEKGLKIMVDEKQVDFELETLSSSPVIKGKISGVMAEDRDYAISLNLSKGLVPDGGKNGLPENKTFTDELSSPFVLLINEVTTEHDGTSGSIYVRTNQLITGNELAQFIAIEPALKYSVEPSDNGLLITSQAFSVENSYSIKLKKGLKGQLGGILKEEYETAVTFGELEPSLSFANNKAVYLSSGGQKNIELRITNVPKIKITVSKVYENNLLMSEYYGYYPKETYDDEYYEDYGGEFNAGDVLYEQEIETRTLPKYGAGRLLHFNPDDKLPGFKGVYHISVRSTQDYWIRSSRFISLSDIGLIAKSGAGKMLVFANSIQSANSLSGVGIQVYASNNQLIGNGSTNSDGVAEITLGSNEAFSGFKPAMVVARLGDDFNFLPFSNTKVNTSKYNVGGKKINSTGLDAFIAPERDLYRPGETIHFAVIVRDLNRKSPGALPVKLKLLMPNGKELTQQRKTLDAEGVTESAIPIPVTAITGTYILELYNGNDVLIRTHNVKVEEFVPDRIKLTARIDKEILKPGQNALLNLDAVNYFGPPAAGRNYEADLRLPGVITKRRLRSGKRYSGLSNLANMILR
ncbi:MAG: MG2 domain-containing protein [Chitinophagaceae bacterium]|nr:MG2 domain-containing protein [Chitinophagaceae bacterium]